METNTTRITKKKEKKKKITKNNKRNWKPMPPPAVGISMGEYKQITEWMNN